MFPTFPGSHDHTRGKVRIQIQLNLPSQNLTEILPEVVEIFNSGPKWWTNHQPTNWWLTTLGGAIDLPPLPVWKKYFVFLRFKSAVVCRKPQQEDPLDNTAVVLMFGSNLVLKQTELKPYWRRGSRNGTGCLPVFFVSAQNNKEMTE